MADVKIRLEELVIEAFPDLVKHLLQLKPEFTDGLKGGFVSLPQAHVRKLQHHAALEHFKAQMFPKRSDDSHKSILGAISEKMVYKFVKEFYKEHGKEKIAKLSPEAVEAQK